MTPFEALRFLGCCLSPATLGPGNPSALEQRMTGQDVDWAGVVRVADRHFVLPLMYSMLRAKNLKYLVPQDLWHKLSVLYDLSSQRSNRLKSQLTEVLRLLNAVGVVPVLLKGTAALYSDIYPDPACRMMKDLDLLVPEDKIDVCVKALKDAGYVSSEEPGSPELYYHAQPLIHPDRIARVELHWELCWQPYTRLLDARRVFQNAVLINERDLRFRLCNALDSVMHNIIEHQLSDKLYYVRTFHLYKVYDVVRLMQISDKGVIWHELFARFKEGGYGRAASVYFMLIQRILHQPTPMGIEPPSHESMEWRLIQALWDLSPEKSYCLRIGANAIKHPNFARAIMHKLFSPETYAKHRKILATSVRGR